MAKKTRLSSRKSKHKLGDKRSDIVQEDRISQLPDEVIVSILSLLTIREAARTSVLSHRWERLWTLFNGSLSFDLTCSPFTTIKKFREQERSKYIVWVNQVLSSLDAASSSSINELIVRFDSDENSRCHIDKWVTFAMERRVQRLELDMMPLECSGNKAFLRYTFPLEFCTHIKQPRGLYSISALTSLCFKYVDITGELIEYFLSNCPLLERLCVDTSEQLSNLKVTGAATFQLKYLEISYCFNLESLEISAPNLLSFNYFGPRIDLHVENVPQLVEVSIGSRFDISNVVGSLSSHFSQIQTLKLDFDSKVHEMFTQHLELTKLKHLILSLEAQNDESLLGWTSLIKASPFLHKFTLELLMIAPRFRRKKNKVTECPHQCLKVVELVGFVGCSTDVELVMYLLASSSALEKIIFDCRNPLQLGTCWESDETTVIKAAKNRALRLKEKLPSGVDVVVI